MKLLSMSVVITLAIAVWILLVVLQLRWIKQYEPDPARLPQTFVEYGQVRFMDLGRGQGGVPIFGRGRRLSCGAMFLGPVGYCNRGVAPEGVPLKVTFSEFPSVSGAVTIVTKIEVGDRASYFVGPQGIVDNYRRNSRSSFFGHSAAAAVALALAAAMACYLMSVFIFT